MSLGLLRVTERKQVCHPTRNDLMMSLAGKFHINNRNPGLLFGEILMIYLFLQSDTH